MESNSTYRKRALANLEDKWFDAAIVAFVYFFIYQGINWVVGNFLGTTEGVAFNLAWMMLCFPLIWSFSAMFLDFIRGEKLECGKLFNGYNDFVRIFIAYFLYFLIISIGCVFLIVPGIIFAFMFGLIPFILKDDKKIGAVDALKKSAAMMKGHKMDMFLLYLSFIGWAILSLLTLGIGFLFLSPYINTTVAHYYEDLKAEYGE